MWAMAWLFWLVLFMVVTSSMRRRRWRRWAMMGPGWYPPYAARWSWRYGHHGYGGDLPDESEWRGGGRLTATPRRGVEERQDYVESLERRIAQLAERLDFTERLLAGRGKGEEPGK